MTTRSIIDMSSTHEGTIDGNDDPDTSLMPPDMTAKIDKDSYSCVDDDIENTLTRRKTTSSWKNTTKHVMAVDGQK